jgi:hypothetical protein
MGAHGIRGRSAVREEAGARFAGNIDGLTPS